MLNKTLLIVSDKFHSFSNKNDVITISDLFNLLSSDTVLFPAPSKIRLVAGQGLNEKQLQEIIKLSTSNKNKVNFDSTLLHYVPKRASKQLTHKHQTENILVSEPLQVNANEFSMDVLIDENCEMMRDHQTGLHIQGMLLVEAARQAYLATMEKFYITDGPTKNYFIFNELNVEYNRFAFPLPSSISLSHTKTDFSNSKRQHTETSIKLLQCGEVSASVKMDVTIMPDIRVSNMENRLAKQTLNSYVETLLSQHLSYEEGELEHA